MEQNTHNDAIIPHVKGNVLKLGISLELTIVRVVNGRVEKDTQEFVPTGKVTAVLASGNYSAKLVATMEGNIARIVDNGTLPVGVYSITVYCRDSSGQPMRFKQRSVVAVYDTTREAGIDPGVEFESEQWILDAAVFFGGIHYDGGGIGEETDPVFSASPAAGITQEDIQSWNSKQAALSWDETPTQGSTKPVRSGGIKAYVDGLIQGLQNVLNTITQDGATQGVIDTFNEVKAFLAGIDTSDPTLFNQLLTLSNAITALQTAVAGKVDKVNGKGLSTNDFTNELLTKLNGLSNYNDTALQTAVSNLQTALQNVYTKSQTYNKSEVDAKVALASGTYQQAVTRSQTDTGSFMWMLVDTVGSDTIRKPIFHVGNGVFVDMAGAVVEIGEVPNAPTFTMSDETSTPNEFPVGGGTVAISAGTGETIYYTTDGTTPTTSSTQYDDTQPIQVTEETTINAIAVNRFGSSEVASETFTIAVDHKFQFKIQLTGNNSTEYIPMTNDNGAKYNLTIDWDDGSTSTYNNDGADKSGVKQGCSHKYTGSAGDEFTITIRGSRCDQLVWGDNTCCNKDALVAILDNSLECDIQFNFASSATDKGFGPNLASICANALHNNTNPEVIFKSTALTSLPDGLLSHLTKSGVALTSCSQMFYGTSIVFTADQLDELKAVIGSVTLFNTMFYNFQGTAALPDDFFNLVAAGTVTKCNNMTASAGSGLTGDAKALYDVLSTKVTASATTSGCFAGGNFENISQVPSGWKE